ncbi:MAG TPA: SDR family oxidoreductase [Bacteroidia bacterium]|nr:SDR family oxidoreductase [Bacteroidia bacterium]
MSNQKHLALITGASKGIGKAIAEVLAKKKIDLLLIARSGDVLKNIAEEFATKYGVKVNFLAADLSLPNAAANIKKWCIENKYDVSILVNNAGYGLWGRFDTLALSEQKNMMQLNMDTLVEMTYEFLPLLKKQSKAYLLNISSTAAYQAVPCLSVYAATKSFVLLFSRGLRYELKKSTVSVTCVCPGATDTSFMDRAGMEALKATAAKFNMMPNIVAEKAVEAMFKGKVEVLPGWMNLVSAKLTSFIPKSLTEKIAGNLYDK